MSAPDTRLARNTIYPIAHERRALAESPVVCPTCTQRMQFEDDKLYGYSLQRCGCGVRRLQPAVVVTKVPRLSPGRGVKPEQSREERQAAIVALLTASSVPLRIADIARTMGRSDMAIQRDIQIMLKERLVARRTVAAVRGGAYTAFGYTVKRRKQVRVYLPLDRPTEEAAA